MGREGVVIRKLNSYIRFKMLKPVSDRRTLTLERHCRECHEPLIGRSDKKFCDDNCRNIFNNKCRSDETGYMRRINNVLRRNRRILKHFHTSGTLKTRFDTLAEMGFIFNFFTGMKSIGTEQYRYVYEYGYLDIGEGSVLIVKNMD